MEYIIRELRKEEYYLLNDFLYYAIFQPDKENLAPKSIINKPELQAYIKNFGEEKDDFCLCAEVNKNVIGSVWVRNINGYGNVDGTTPEFAISVYEDFRGHGIGTVMMKAMLSHLRKCGYKLASLAVQKKNYALRMYLNIGFKIACENEEEYIMVYDFLSES